MANSIQINGALGKSVAAIVVALLIASVIGVWNMNGQLNRIATDLTWLKQQVQSNTTRLDRR